MNAAQKRKDMRALRRMMGHFSGAFQQAADLVLVGNKDEAHKQLQECANELRAIHMVKRSLE